MGRPDIRVLNHVALRIQQLVGVLLPDGSVGIGNVHPHPGGGHGVHVVLQAAEGDGGRLNCPPLGHIHIGFVHRAYHVQGNGNLPGIEVGDPDSQSIGGLPLNGNVVIVHIVRRRQLIGLAVAAYRVNVRQVDPDPQVLRAQVGDHRPGAPELHGHRGVPSLGQHQAPAGEGILFPDELNGDVSKVLGDLVALGRVNEQPEHNGQQKA